jgi:hypothetical protein
MGVLQRFEKRLGGLVEGGFARLFHGRVEPVELAAALARDADNNKAVGPQRVLVPNIYDIDLSHSDFDRLAPYAITLGDELAVMVSEHAAEQGYSFVGPVAVTLHEEPSLSTGSFRISSRVEAGPDGPARMAEPDRSNVAVHPPLRSAAPVFPPSRAAPVPEVQPAAPAPPAAAPPPAPVDPPSVSADPAMTTVLRPTPPPTFGRLVLADGTEAAIDQPEVILGRGADADIRITDASVSRRHARVTVVGRVLTIEDLGSTNGTFHNGRQIGRATLSDGDEVKLGASTVLFRS